MTPADLPITGEAEWLRQYGPWALLVVCFGVIIFLYRELAKQRSEQIACLDKHAKELKDLGEAHKEEMGAVLNRLVETSTTQIREYHGLAEKITTVVDTLSKRLEGRGGRP